LSNVREWWKLISGANRATAAFCRPTDMCEPDRLMIYALVGFYAPC
jgi:hypothetical protein